MNRNLLFRQISVKTDETGRRGRFTITVFAVQRSRRIQCAVPRSHMMDPPVSPFHTHSTGMNQHQLMKLVSAGHRVPLRIRFYTADTQKSNFRHQMMISSIFKPDVVVHNIK